MIGYKHQLTTYLWRRANRQNPVTGQAPISLRIEIEGFPRAEFVTAVKATEAEWRSQAQRLYPTRGMAEEEAKLLQLANSKLARYLLAVEQAYDSYCNQGGHPSPAELREFLRHGRSKDHESKQLLRVAELFYQDFSDPKRCRRPNTLAALHKSIGKIREYCAHTKQTYVLAEHINRAWCRGFDRWCNQHAWDASTIQKHIAALRRIVGFAADEGLIATNQIERYTYLTPKEEKAKRHVSKAEIARLETHRFKNPSVQRVADIFLFSYYTGLTIADYLRFAADPNAFLCSEEGVLGIRMTRQKMMRKGKEFWVPLFPKAHHLFFVVYKERLPIYTDGHVLNKLKIIAAALQFHLLDLKHKDARSSFAQHMRDKYGLEVAAGMAGHSQQIANQHYSTTSPKRIVEQINIVSGLPNTQPGRVIPFRFGA